MPSSLMAKWFGLLRRGSNREPDPHEIDRLFEALGAGGDAIDRLAERRTDDVVRRLIDLIAEDDSSRRLQAAKVLRKMREPRAVEVLAEAMEHRSDWQLRQEAIEALGDIGDERAVDPLLAKFEDETEDDTPRSLAAYALAQIGAAAAIEPLERLVAAIPRESLEDDVVGYAAEEAASQLRAMHPGIERAPKPGAGYFLNRLSDTNADIRVRAIEGLRRRADTSAVEPLIRALADDVPAVRAAAAEALGSLGDARAIAPLAALTRDVAVAPPSTRTLAPRGVLVCDKVSMALGTLGGADAETALVDSVMSESADVRMAAAQALVATQRSRRVLEALDRLLDDPDREVRQDAVHGLGDWKLPEEGAPSVNYSDTDVIAVLERAFRDPEEHVRGAALYAIDKFWGRAEAQSVFDKALTDSDWLVRRDAVFLLGTHRADHALPRLREMLRHDEDDSVRSEAAQAIGCYFCRAEDMDALVAALDDPSDSVRALAAYAIGDLYEQNQGPHRNAARRLLELADDPSGRVQENARRALSKLGIEPPPSGR